MSLPTLPIVRPPPSTGIQGRGYGGHAIKVKGSNGLLFIRMDQYTFSQTVIPETIQVYVTDVLFDLNVAGNVLSWMAVGNAAAQDANHNSYLIGVEEQQDLVYVVMQQGTPKLVTIKPTGSTSTTISSLNITVLHTYRIVVTTPGSRIDAYVDGVLVATNTTNMSTAQIIPFIELANPSTTTASLARLDSFGGMFGVASE